MSNRTLDAAAFEDSVSYFNTTFEDILAGIIVTYFCIIATKTEIPLNDEKEYIDDDAYYIIECKRLNAENQKGEKSLNGKYISNGIARFTNERKYQFYNNTAQR